MRRAVKKAELQNPVLTNRKYIRGILAEASKHTFVMPLTNNR